MPRKVKKIVRARRRRLLAILSRKKSLYSTRRLVEAGVRFVQVFCPVGSWDTHSTNNATVKKMCEMTDQPTAAQVCRASGVQARRVLG